MATDVVVNVVVVVLEVFDPLASLVLPPRSTPTEPAFGTLSQ